MTSGLSVVDSAKISPHGSTMSEWPYVEMPSTVVPTWAAATMNEWFSTARDRTNRSQWARPVIALKAAGTAMTSAPARASFRYSSGNRTSKQIDIPSANSSRLATTISSPGSMMSDSRCTMASGTLTSKRWILRYVATISPLGLITTLVLKNLPGSGDFSRRLPRCRISARDVASSAIRDVVGPGTVSAAPSKPENGPRKLKYSGSCTYLAPSSAASLTNDRASSTLRATSEPDESCTAATLSSITTPHFTRNVKLSFAVRESASSYDDRRGFLVSLDRTRFGDAEVTTDSGAISSVLHTRSLAVSTQP